MATPGTGSSSPTPSQCPLRMHPKAQGDAGCSLCHGAWNQSHLAHLGHKLPGPGAATSCNTWHSGARQSPRDGHSYCYRAATGSQIVPLPSPAAPVDPGPSGGSPSPHRHHATHDPTPLLLPDPRPCTLHAIRASLNVPRALQAPFPPGRPSPDSAQHVHFLNTSAHVCLLGRPPGHSEQSCGSYPFVFLPSGDKIYPWCLG